MSEDVASTCVRLALTLLMIGKALLGKTPLDKTPLGKALPLLGKALRGIGLSMLAEDSLADVCSGARKKELCSGSRMNAEL